MTLWYSIKLLHFNFLPDKQEQEAVNQDKDVDYNSDVNEAESETDKQAALAGIENGKKEKKTVLNQISHAENIKIIFCMASCSKLYLANLFFELSLMFTVWPIFCIAPLNLLFSGEYGTLLYYTVFNSPYKISPVVF